METEALIGGDRRGFRHRKRIIFLLLATPLFLFLLGNLFLGSPWTCRWIAGKIQSGTGLQASVSGASWSPWNGAVIDQVELLQPAPLRAALKEPLVRIGAVHLAPVWRAWLHGRLEVQSIELIAPRVVLPLEMVSYLARSSSPASPLPTAAANPPPPTPAIPAVPPVKAPLPAAPSTRSQPTGWLRLKNASFAVVLAGSHDPLLELSETSGSIPLSGESARAALTVGLVSAGGKKSASNLTATLEWAAPMLTLESMEVKIGASKFFLSGKIARFSGLPIQIEGHLPPQALAEFGIPFGGRAAAESIAVHAIFRGLLLAPVTWQGDWVAEAIAPSIHIGPRTTKFDRGSAIVVLRHGVVSCVDARLMSDDLSLLANATLLPDGRAAGGARLVAAPETVAAIAGRIFPTIANAPSLTPLGTAQRAAFDLEAFGNPGNLFLRLGRDGPVVNVKH